MFCTINSNIGMENILSINLFFFFIKGNHDYVKTIIANRLTDTVYLSYIMFLN